MWEDIALALACVGFTVAVALVALELGTIGRAADARYRDAVRTRRPYDHARP